MIKELYGLAGLFVFMTTLFSFILFEEIYIPLSINTNVLSNPFFGCLFSISVCDDAFFQSELGWSTDDTFFQPELGWREWALLGRTKMASRLNWRMLNCLG